MQSPLRSKNEFELGEEIVSLNYGSMQSGFSSFERTKSENSLGS